MWCAPPVEQWDILQETVSKGGQGLVSMSLASLLHLEATKLIKSICHLWLSWVMDHLGMDQHLLDLLLLLGQEQDLLHLDHLVVEAKINLHLEELCLLLLEETGAHLEEDLVATPGPMEDHLLAHLVQVPNHLCLNLYSLHGEGTRRMETVEEVTMTGIIPLHLLETCLHGKVVKVGLQDTLVPHLLPHPKALVMEAVTAGECHHGLEFLHHLLVVQVVLLEALGQFLHLPWATGTRVGVSHNLGDRIQVNSPIFWEHPHHHHLQVN